MEFIAHIDIRTIFGTFESMEQHALAYSQEGSERCFSNGMKIFKPDSSSLTALKLVSDQGETVCIYREIADIDNGVFRVRIWDRPNSYDEKTMSRQALKKMVLFKISQEFAEPAEQID